MAAAPSIFNYNSALGSGNQQNVNNVVSSYNAIPGNTAQNYMNTPSAGGAKQNGGWYDGTQYWAPGQGPSTGGSGGGSGGGTNNGSGGVDINAIFQPQIDEANRQEGVLNQNKTTGLANAATDFGNLTNTLQQG